MPKLLELETPLQASSVAQIQVDNLEQPTTELLPESKTEMENSVVRPSQALDSLFDLVRSPEQPSQIPTSLLSHPPSVSIDTKTSEQSTKQLSENSVEIMPSKSAVSGQFTNQVIEQANPEQSILLSRLEHQPNQTALSPIAEQTIKQVVINGETPTDAIAVYPNQVNGFEQPQITRHVHSSTSLEQQTAAKPTIQITIGRIDVRAITQSTPASQRVAKPAPKISLDDYLRSSTGGKG